MLSTGDRVRVDREGAPEGVVVGAQVQDSAYVRLDNGQASTFPVSELTVLAPESKSWPPKGIETK